MRKHETYAKKAAETAGSDTFLQDFAKDGTDSRAVRPVAIEIKKLAENLFGPMGVKIRGFSVPRGSLALFHYLYSDLERARQAALEDDDLSAAMAGEEKEEFIRLFDDALERVSEMAPELLRSSTADQLEKRTDSKAAMEASGTLGHIPLYLDEKTMGQVINTLSVQLFLDRFNLVFKGLDPVGEEDLKNIVPRYFAPLWKKHAENILFVLNEEEPGGRK